MKTLDRRTFIKTAAVTTGIAGLSCSTKDQTVLPTSSLPSRKIGELDVSRMILGGNPFSGISHGEPLVYTNKLFKQYLTHEKIVEVMRMSVAGGINTFLGRVDDNTIGFLKKYKQETGTMMPWLAQTSAKPMRGATPAQIRENIKWSVDNGATGVYIQGQSADYFVQENQIQQIVDHLNYIRDLGNLAGVGAHDYRTIAACEEAGIVPDFYMKTLNPLEYNCPDYEDTLKVMAQVTVPWIAFKVLAAGRIDPKEGFKQALDAGADFLCVGMFDFQVDENLELFRSLI